MLEFLSSQIDFIFYCQALGLFLLGAVLYGYSRVAYQHLRWNWALLFVFFQFSYYSTTLFGLSWGFSSSVENFIFLLVPLSYFCLLRFCSSLCLDSCKKKIPDWIFFIPVILSIAFLWKGVESAHYATNYLLRVPCFLFLSLIFFVDYKKGHERSRFLLGLISALLIFSFFLLLYPPLLPGRVGNVFINFLSLFILISISYKFESERLKLIGADYKKTVKKGWFLRYFPYWLMGIVLCGGFGLYELGQKKEEQLRDSFLRSAQNTSKIVHKTNLIEGQNEKIYEELRSIFQLMPLGERFFLVGLDKDHRPFLYQNKDEPIRPTSDFQSSLSINLTDIVAPLILRPVSKIVDVDEDDANKPFMAVIPLQINDEDFPLGFFVAESNVTEFKREVFQFRLIPILVLSLLTFPLVFLWLLNRRNQEDEILRLSRTTKMLARQKVLLEISNLRKENLFEFFSCVNEKLASLVRVDRLSVWLFSSDGKNLICRDLYVKATGEHKALQEMYVEHYPRFFRILGGQRSFISQHLPTDERASEVFDKFFKPHETQSLMAIPLRGHGRLLGVMNFELINDSYDWDFDDRDFCCSFADAVALAIDNYELEKLKNEKRNLEGQIISSSKLMAVGTLASGLAHEINNPLSVIRGYLESNQDKFRQVDDLPRIWERMMFAVGRIEKVVRGLRLYSQSADENIKECSIKDVISQSLVLLSPLYEQDHIRLDWDDKVGNTRIHGNPGRIHEVLVNLLSNARDAVLEIEKDRLVRLVSSVENGRYKLDIYDNGEGIKSSVLPRVFDPFFTTKAPGKGTGLGLYSAHSIVTFYGGSITIESLEGNGTVVHLDLPVVITKEVIHRDLNSQKDEAIAESFLKILVVDDEPDVREIVSEYLERKGMHVTLAKDGIEGLEFIQNNHYDVVVTDIKMPRMRGDKLIEEAKKIPNLKSKFIVMTGGVEWDDEKRAVELADHQLRKPFEFKHFFKVIQSVSKESL